LASTSASQSNTTNTTYTDSTYSDTFESLQNTRSPSHPAAPPAIPLPRQILELRKQVEEYSKSGNKMQLLESLELLEAALVQHKIESSKTAESKKFRAREKQRRAEARRARHHQKFQQLRRESAENLRFRRENEDLLNQLQTAKELYESEKNSSKQLSNLASSRQSEIDIIKTASEELETKLSDVGSQVLQVSQGCVCTGGAKRRGSEVSRKEAFVC
jgi:DNA repair exonuclease SbcCD ATPase subunit